MEPTLSLLDVRHALLRHGRKAALFFAACVLITTLLALFWPRVYQSEAQLFVKLGRPSVRLDPTATTGQTIAVNESRETEINSILEVLRSRALAERVVDELGSDVILSGDVRPAGGEPAAAGSRAAGSRAAGGGGGFLGTVLGGLRAVKHWLQGTEGVPPRDQAVDEVLGMLSIGAPRRTNVIAIRCRARTPRLAQQVTDSLLRAYQAEHVRVHQTVGAFEFFDQETRRRAAQLDQASDRVREAKNELGWLSADSQESVLRAQLESIERDADTTAVQLAAAEARLAAVAQAASELPERVVSREEHGFANVAGDAMRNQLFELEIHERELRSKYTDRHPAVLAVGHQVQEARQILAQQTPQRSQQAEELNPNRQRLLLSELELRAETEALRARQAGLNQRRSEVLVRIQRLNDAEVRLARLRREADLLDQSYRLYAEKLEQARTDQALDRQRISNINVFQQATFCQEPVSPRLGMMAVFGLAFGLLGGMGVALLAETIDRSLKSADEVERQLGLPVLVSLPRFPLDPVLRN